MSRPGQRRRVRNVAQWVRNLFPPPPLRSPERRWAGEQPRSRERRGDRVEWGVRGRNARQAPGGKTLPLSVRPEKSSLAAASRERAGGRPNGEGSRGVRNGCHVGQVGRRPPPPRRDLWFVPGLRLSSWARPAGPDPATRRPGPAGAPSPPAPSGDLVGPVGLPQRTRSLLPPKKALPKA